MMLARRNNDPLCEPCRLIVNEKRRGIAVACAAFRVYRDIVIAIRLANEIRNYQSAALAGLLPLSATDDVCRVSQTMILTSGRLTLSRLSLGSGIIYRAPTRTRTHTGVRYAVRV